MKVLKKIMSRINDGNEANGNRNNLNYLLNEIITSLHTSVEKISFHKYLYSQWDSDSINVFNSARQAVQNQEEISNYRLHHLLRMILGFMDYEPEFYFFLESLSSFDKFNDTYILIKQAIFDYNCNTIEKKDFPDLSKYQQSIILQTLIDYMQKTKNIDFHTKFNFRFQNAYESLNHVTSLIDPKSEENTMEFIMSQ